MGAEEKMKEEMSVLQRGLDLIKKHNLELAVKNETLIFGGLVPPLPPDFLRSNMGTPTVEAFLFTADLWNHLVSQQLNKKSVILEIECGCGKLARGLISHAHVEKYIGCDIHKPNIDWCVKYLTPFSKNRFQFFHYDVYSKTFNSKGKIQVEDVEFLAKDSSVDLVISLSLYTRVFEKDARHYLKETCRVLKPGGQFMPSIHNQPKAGSYFSGDELKVDIDSDYFIKMVQKEGMQLDKKLGMLAGQEVFLFKKT